MIFIADEEMSMPNIVLGTDLKPKFSDKILSLSPNNLPNTKETQQ